jgi:hypothetical protein
VMVGSCWCCVGKDGEGWQEGVAKGLVYVCGGGGWVVSLCTLIAGSIRRGLVLAIPPAWQVASSLIAGFVVTNASSLHRRLGSEVAEVVVGGSSEHPASSALAALGPTRALAAAQVCGDRVRACHGLCEQHVYACAFHTRHSEQGTVWLAHVGQYISMA